MTNQRSQQIVLAKLRDQFPQKFAQVETVFSKIRRGARIFTGTGCGEPQYLVRSLIQFVESHPKALLDAELSQVWTLGVVPYMDDKYKYNFRHSSFFIANNTREAVNSGKADYTPIFLFEVPKLFTRGSVHLDVALIQTAPPDEHGFFNLGISVDIVKAAIESAGLVIAQVNANMPCLYGDGFVHIDDLDYIIPFDEPVLEYQIPLIPKMARKIGSYVAKLIQDGDTIQVGYGSVPNAILPFLIEKKHLGIHTELLSTGLVDLIQKGVVDNKLKSIDRGKSVATYCMGTQEAYQYIHDNPAIEFRTIDYTNNPAVIAQIDNMTAINSALEIDLTGQATAESIGRIFYSGIGGQADFMRGAVLAKNGKTILTLESTAKGSKISRIVPFLSAGAGVTLNRGDIHYVVTEFGIAYLHGKNIRERAMELIAIAHPKFRAWLIEEAKKLNLIYSDQKIITGKGGEYPEDLETYKTTKTGLEVFLRPVKISDEPLLKEFFYSLSDESLYHRFLSMRKDMPHERLQEFVVIDYTKELVILATIKIKEKERILGLIQYAREETAHTAEFAVAIRDDYQGCGLGTELLSYVLFLAKKQGLLGITAHVLFDNRAMLHIMEKLGFVLAERATEGVFRLKLMFAKQ